MDTSEFGRKAVDNHDATEGGMRRSRFAPTGPAAREARFDSAFLTIVREHGLLLERIDNSRA